MLWALYIFAIGLDIPVAYYEKSETIMVDTKINNNGYDYVDFELPSGTLWATCNVGSNKPTDYGLYFQWGDTIGYTKEQIGKDKQFNWNDYKFSIDGSNTNFSKYAEEGETLELEDDAAHVNMGGSWHMPSHKQIMELIYNTTTEWTTLDEANGMKFSSKKDSSKFIFIPAAGYAWHGSFYNYGTNGFIWSSMSSKELIDSGQLLGIYLGGAYPGGLSSRYYGFSVRGVIG